MSAQPASLPKPAALAGGGVTLPRVLRSEWRKLFSLRSTWWLLGIGTVAMLGLAFGLATIAAAVSSSDSLSGTDGGTGLEGTQAIVSSLAANGLTVTGILLAVVAIINMAGEYTTHTSLSTFAAVPTRWPVYVAKTIILGLIGFVGGVVLHVIASYLVVGAFKMFNVKVETLGGEMWQEALISGLLLLVMVWMGLGLGALMRNTAVAIVIVAIFFYVISNILTVVAVFANNDVVQWFSNHLPTAAIGSLRPSTRAAYDQLAASPDSVGVNLTHLAVWDAWVTVGFWALVPLVLGFFAVKFRPVR